MTILHYEDPSEIRSGRIRSTQVHFHPALDRERRFRMPDQDDAPPIKTIHFSLGPQKLFIGRLTHAAASVDQRLAFARVMEDLERQGVTFRKTRVTPDDLNELAGSYELLIDASGKSGPLAPFPVEPELTPFQTPQRKCAVGYFKGVAPVRPEGVSITVVPGVGEMFEIPALSESGPVTVLFVEAVPEGALDAFKGVKTPQDFQNRMESILKESFPDIFGRLDPGQFSLADEQAYLLTAITPVVRRPYAMRNGTLVLGCGDSAILADPITGQGCNTASYCADRLYETLLERRDSPWDETVGADYWNRVRTYVKEVTEWTNAMTGPLPGHVVNMLMQAAADQSAADKIVHWFEAPSTAHAALFGT